MTLILKTKKSLFSGLVDDFFDADLFQRSGNFNINSRVDLNLTNTPSVKIREELESYKIELAAPGFDAADFEIEVVDDILTISMEKSIETEEEDEDYNRKEFSYQCFNRSILIPENALIDEIKIMYSNGILELTLPKQTIAF